jgi:hypothetical protein
LHPATVALQAGLYHDGVAKDWRSNGTQLLDPLVLADYLAPVRPPHLMNAFAPVTVVGVVRQLPFDKVALFTRKTSACHQATCGMDDNCGVRVTDWWQQ